MNRNQDPRIALMDFLRAIPINLRIDEYLFIIIMCVGSDAPDDLEDFEPMVQKYLSRSGYAGLGAVICTKAVLEYRLKDILLKLESAEKNIRAIMDMNPEFTQHPLLSMPLKKKQYAQVLDRWRTLLNGPLSDGNIAYFEGNPQDLPPVTA